MTDELKRLIDERDMMRSTLYLCKTEAKQAKYGNKPELQRALRTIEELADEMLKKAEPVQPKEPPDEQTRQT